jgi:hypothetical protein
MANLTIILTCCGKAMRQDESLQEITPADESIRSWFCEKCGKYINIIKGQMSEEELQQQLGCPVSSNGTEDEQ